MTDMKKVIHSLLPSGPVWESKPLGDWDKLIDAIGDVKTTVKNYIAGLRYVRDPQRTPFFEDLEKEYGITPVPTATEQERRDALSGVVYASPGIGADDLQARLHAAGLTELFVYQNDPAIDPAVYIDGEWACVCGNEDAVCGNENAYVGQQGGGGYLLVNGPVFESSGDQAEYGLPDTGERWHLVFFIGGEKTSPTFGFFVVEDGDMEYTAGTSLLADWDMEEVGIADWTVAPLSTIGKFDATPTGRASQAILVPVGGESAPASDSFAPAVQPMTASTEYTMGFFYYNTGAAVSIEVGGVEIWDDSGLPWSTWNYQEVTFTATGSAELNFIVVAGMGTSNVLFDDVMLVEGAEIPDPLRAWTAGGGATLSKDTTTVYEGSQSLKVEIEDDYSLQSADIDVIDPGIENAFRMHDSGAGTIYDVAANKDDIDNAEVLNFPTLTPADNATDATSLEFDGVSDGAGGAIQELQATGAISFWAKINDASREDSFVLRPETSGYKALASDKSLTINGTTVAPAIWLEGEDADLTSWDDLENSNSFSLVGSGSDPEFDELTPGLQDKRVKLNGNGSNGKFYRAAGSSVADPGTDDVVCEFVFNSGDLSNVAFVSSKFVSGADRFDIQILTTGVTRVIISTATLGSTTINSGKTLVANTWYTGHVFKDSDGSLSYAINGDFGPSTDISAGALETPGSAGSWAIGARSDDATWNDISVAYFAMWHAPAWLDTDQQYSVAAERFAKICGTYASVAQTVSIIQDGDAETSGVGSWTSANGAALTKETGTRTGGDGSQVLRVTGDGATANPQARQTSLPGENRTVVSGWARSDGTELPTVQVGGTTLWTGTSSTSWQYFSEDLAGAVGTTDLRIGLLGVTSGYVEFDDVRYDVDGAIPSTQSRATEAFIEKWLSDDSKVALIPVGDSWFRTDRIKDDSGALGSGLRLETSATNLLLYSEDFSDANWTKPEVTIGTPIAGLGGQNFDAIVASVNSATHYVDQSVTVVVDETSASIFAKQGNVSGIKIEIVEGTNQYAYFDLDTGVVGTVGAGLLADLPARIEPKGDGIFRCEIRFDPSGTTSTFRVYSTDGETDAWVGDGSTPSTYLFGAQLDNGSELLSSYVATTTATVTRLSDESLDYYGYENIPGGASPSVVNMSLELYSPMDGSNRDNGSVCGLDDGSTNNRMSFSFLASSHAARFFASSGGAAQCSETVSDQNTTEFRKYEFFAAADNFRGAIDRAEVASDVSGSMPTGLTRINIGRNLDTNPLHRVLRNFTLSPYGLANPRGFAFANDGNYEGPFIAYDALDIDAGQFELRAAANQGGTTDMNGGILIPNTWYHIAMLWTPAFSALYVDAVSVDTGAAGAVTGVDQIRFGWAGLLNYDVSTVAPETVTFGDVSIADARITGGQTPTVAWLAELVSRGAPRYERGLVHEIGIDTQGGVLEGGGNVFYKDFVSGELGDMGSTVNATSGSTEVGIGIHSRETTQLLQLDFGSGVAFLQSQDQSFSVWARFDGSGDQLLWSNGAENSTTWQAAYYDASEGKVKYVSVIGATLREVAADIDTGRLYHIIGTRDYDGADTTMTLALDGDNKQSGTWTGAPVVSADNLYMFESGGSPAMQMSGVQVSPKFFDVAMTELEATTVSDEGEAIILNGPYATQEITPTVAEALFQGLAYIDAPGVAIAMYQEIEGGPWRAANIVDDVLAGTWEAFSKTTNVFAFRLYSKGYGVADHDAIFDLIDGGDSPGSEQIEIVDLSETKRKTLEDIVLRHKPLHSWAVVVARYS